MIQGVYKFRTDIRRTKREQHRADQKLFDMQINRICRLILFVKYLFTFRVQEAKAALDLDKELSPEEEVKLRNMISKYLSRTPYVRETPKIGRNQTTMVYFGRKKTLMTALINYSEQSLSLN